ncbi:hypothetical protein KAK07_24080 [Ideonella sp. 4Y16]|uniref:DUF8198 domain-containing protein n=1 Tax=Ideonella alba TaxID=2824118 RepID=A0A940YN09_9BURK|nr:hypothetical protein [Ideonella alba]MBQ0932729.1 hypothetical protein [Ideonella alba]MBQ0946436.1 hypothetical protein [Ideonella alba]
MAADQDSILRELGRVEAERQARLHDPALAGRVVALKRYQQARFACTHADLLADARYGPAARFFLEDLYGPQDFADRDAQFARIVPALVRLFPQEIVETVQSLVALHALTESLDSRMARALPSDAPDRRAYVQAWQQVGAAEERRQQLARVLDLGAQLDRYTRRPLLRQSLRLMRGPARSAGLGALQQFLERGFDTFAAMRGAQDFLARVQQREGALMNRLFAPDAVAVATAADAGVAEVIGQLP